MKYIGAHISASGGVEQAPRNAYEIKANAFALFVKNQKRWTSPQLTEKNISDFKKSCMELGYTKDQILPHNSYLINPGSPEPEMLEKSRDAFLDEIKRCEMLDLKYLNFHPGAHKNLISEDDCLKICAETINICHQNSQKLILVIENTAGQGTRTGSKFEQLKKIIDRVDDKSRVGICIDTCHAFAAGYDLSSYETSAKVFEEFNSVIGFEWLCGMHLNDSMHPLGSKKDRHANIGNGEIGFGCFMYIMQDDRFNGIPLILETRDSEKWAQEIELLRKMQDGK